MYMHVYQDENASVAGAILSTPTVCIENKK